VRPNLGRLGEVSGQHGSPLATIAATWLGESDIEPWLRFRLIPVACRASRSPVETIRSILPVPRSDGRRTGPEHRQEGCPPDHRRSACVHGTLPVDDITAAEDRTIAELTVPHCDFAQLCGHWSWSFIGFI
jgi:hypothetical protein